MNFYEFLKMFQIKQEKFEGPLDVLLDLILKEELVITEISLAKVAEEYIRHVKSLEKIDAEALAEFLVIAAQLMLIKSKVLLPSLKISEEEEESIEELENRLQEYKKIRELSGFLKKIELQGRHIFPRSSFLGIERIFHPPPNLPAEKLCGILRELLEAVPKIEKVAEDKIKRIVSLEERIESIRDFLQKSIEKSFSELVGKGDKSDVIVSFLALLELTRQKFVELNQKNLFEDILIKRL